MAARAGRPESIAPRYRASRKSRGGPAGGAGNINVANVTLPANGSVTYTITGTLDPAATCGTTVANGRGLN
jgi:hypothetical protein